MPSPSRLQMLDLPYKGRGILSVKFLRARYCCTPTLGCSLKRAYSDITPAVRALSYSLRDTVDVTTVETCSCYRGETLGRREPHEQAMETHLTMENFPRRKYKDRLVSMFMFKTILIFFRPEWYRISFCCSSFCHRQRLRREKMTLL